MYNCTIRVSIWTISGSPYHIRYNFRSCKKKARFWADRKYLSITLYYVLITACVMGGYRCCRLIITQTITVTLQGYQRPHAGTDWAGLIIWSMLKWAHATTGRQTASHLCEKSACSSWISCGIVRFTEHCLWLQIHIWLDHWTHIPLRSIWSRSRQLMILCRQPWRCASFR